MIVKEGLMTSTGQITIPILIRQELGIKEGEKIVFVSDKSSCYLQRHKNFLENPKAPGINLLSFISKLHKPIIISGASNVERNFILDCIIGSSKDNCIEVYKSLDELQNVAKQKNSYTALISLNELPETKEIHFKEYFLVKCNCCLQAYIEEIQTVKFDQPTTLYKG